MRLRPPAAVLVAALAVAPVLVAPPAASAACETPARVEGPFRSVPKPADLLPGPLVAHAVEPADPSTVYLADARTVAVSTDAGCTWDPLLQLPAAPATSISSLVVPASPEPTGRLLVAVTTTGLRSFASTTVVHSRLGAGQPFRTSQPLSGGIRPVVSPGDPDVVYAATDDLVGGIGVAPYRSTDGGATWLPQTGTRTYPAASASTADSASRHVAVDPGERDRVLVGSNSLQESRDGGASFGVRLGGSELRHAHGLAAHLTGGDAAGTVVVVGTGNSTTGMQSTTASAWSVPPDGTPTRLSTTPLVGVVSSLAAGRSADEVVLTTADLGGNLSDGYDGPGGLWLYDGVADTWVDVVDGRGHPLRGAQVDLAADPAVHLHSSSLTTPAGADEYVVYAPPAVGRVVPPTVDDGTGTGTALPEEGFPPAPRACPAAPVFAPPTRRASSALLTPATATLPVDAAGRARHEVELALAGDAVALDLLLLLDTSDSMGPAASGLVCGLEELVTGLADDGVDLQVGLAEFWDAGPGQRYRRLVDLAPPDEELQRALRLLTTRGGEETHRTALYQAVTGEGLVVGGTEVVAPGQAATFRPDAARVVLHVTDEPWTATTPGEPTPFAVVEALNAAGVRHVGLQVVTAGSTLAPAGDRAAGLERQAVLRTQLDQFSAGTGAVAPAGGVDCDGDGAADLREGDPLVCTGRVRDGVVPVAAPVRALVDALRVRGPVELEAVPPPGAAATSEQRYDDVDLRGTSRLAFPVALDCGTAQGPALVDLRARAGGVPVAQASVVLACPAAPVAPAPEPAAGPAPAPVPGADPPAPAGVAAAPPAPPPLPVQVPAPAPAPAAAQAPAVAAAGAAAGAGAGSAAGSAAVSAAGSAAGSGAASSQAGTAAGLAGAPSEPQRRAQGAFVQTAGDGVPLAAVPLAGGLLATAALTTHLLATRRRPPAPAPVRSRPRPEDLP